MPDILQQLQDRETLSQNQRLEQAAHAADWTSTFNGDQSTEALRAQRNVTDMVNSAMQRKLELAAQTDKNSQEIYQKGEQFKEWQLNAPLRDELLRSKIAAQGATARLQAQKQIDTHNDVAGFADYMLGAPPIGDPAHHNYVIAGIGKFPHVASTTWGASELKNGATAHDVAAAAKEAAKQAAFVNEPATEYFSPQSLLKDNPGATFRQNAKTGGFLITTEKGKTEIGESGAIQYYSPEALLAENPGASIKQDPKTGGYYVGTIKGSPVAGEANVKNYGLTPAQFNSAISVARVSPNSDEAKRESQPFVGDKSGNTVQVTFLGNDGKIKRAFIPKADYLKFGGKLAAGNEANPIVTATPAAPQRKALGEIFK